MPFACTICAEESTTICARCTQDTCRNHLCERCRRCSDCCECEVALQEDVRVPVRAAHAAPEHSQAPEERDEENWQPPPGPDPLPPEDPEPGPVEP